jgi:hypothetical protein
MPHERWLMEEHAVRILVAALFVSVLLVCSVAAVGQAAPPTQGPSPEQQMMGYFAGDWTMQGTMKVGPTSPGAPFSSKEHGAWVPGGFFMETHSSMKSPMGTIEGTRVMGYNPEDKTFTYNAYNSLGEHILAVGTAKGNVWTWNSEAKMNGLVTKGRYTVTVISPTAYTFSSEIATPSGGWSTVMEGKASRMQ